MLDAFMRLGFWTLIGIAMLALLVTLFALGSDSGPGLPTYLSKGIVIVVSSTASAVCGMLAWLMHRRFAL